MTIPFDWQAPSYRWFQLWRKYVRNAQQHDENQDVHCHIAALAQMHYQCCAALEFYEYFKQTDSL